MASEKKETVCVTGAGGFLASWTVQLLLSEGYIVHGTVRDPQSDKYAHLRKLDKASENLKLFKADLLDYDSLCSAIDGCTGVFHVASPVPPSAVTNPQVDLLDPAVKGTRNVLQASSKVGVRRVVYVSSVVALMMNPNWPKNKVLDESCWSDQEYCRTTANWYCLSKTEAESEAFEYAKRIGITVVSVCPSLIFGPLLQPTINASSLVLFNLVKGGEEAVPNKLRMIVDVRDVAAAMLLVYNKPEAEGRYICTSHDIKVRDLVDKLRSLFPDLPYPTKFTEVENQDLQMPSAKLQKLGWTYRPLEETLSDAIDSFRKSGLLG